MTALRIADADILFYPSGFFFFLFSSPILRRRRLDVYHTSTHDVALVTHFPLMHFSPLLLVPHFPVQHFQSSRK